MMYAHTIAIARTLLADGHTDEVRRMLAPLAAMDDTGLPKSKALANNRLLLRGLYAQTLLLEGDTPSDVVAQLAPYHDPHSPLDAPGAAAVALWLGWAYALPGAIQNLPRALHLLRQAARAFERHDRTDWLYWPALGQAMAYYHLGERAQAAYHLQKATRILNVFYDLLALKRIDLLRASLAEDSPAHPDEAGPAVVCYSPAMREVLHQAALAAPSYAPVLIAGMRGTGKTRLARFIHDHSPVASGNFIAVNCETQAGDRPLVQVLTEALEAEAEPRTLFLNHVDWLPDASQAQVLNYLERHDFRKSDPSAERAVRIVAATSCNLVERAQRGAFSRELFQRLQMLSLHLMPLTDRREDIPLLAWHFVRALAPASIPFAAITEDALQALIAYAWPGNVRQLRNEIERALVHIGQEPFPVVDLDDLSSALQTNQAAPSENEPDDRTEPRDYRLDMILSDTERRVIERALSDHQGHVSATADALGLTRQGLYKKMKRLGIDAAHTNRAREALPFENAVNAP